MQFVSGARITKTPQQRLEVNIPSVRQHADVKQIDPQLSLR